MPIDHYVTGHEASLTIRGMFNFAEHDSFRKACNQMLAQPGITSIEINLMETDYLDSSALGMLLVLREQALSHGVTQLMITNPRPAVRQILTIAKFDRFFQMD